MLKKLMKKLVTALFSIIILSGIVVFAETVETKLVVDESDVLKSSAKDMLGINGNWYSERLFLGGNTSMEVSDEYINAVNGLNIPIVLSRMSGADSQTFNWKDSLGDGKERSGGNLGIVEWIKAHRKANPDVGFTYTINIMEDSVEDHKDLVRFLFLMPDDPNAVGSDGVNWAQKRVDLGLTEPVNIKTFELGNEVYYDYVKGCLDNIEVNLDDVSSGVRAYVSDCIEIINAMNSVKSDISFTASCFTYTKKTGDDAKIWNEYLVNNLAGLIDYVAYHEYYYNYNFYWYTMQLNQYLYQYIRKLPENVRPDIYHSEYGYWMSGYDLDELKDGTSLYGTLINAKFLNNIINMPYIKMASIHVTHERISTDDFWRTGWDLFRIYDDGKIYCTAPTEMLKIFNEALGSGKENENVVSVSLSGNQYVGGYGNFSGAADTPVDALTVSAHTTSENGVNIILVNGAENVTHNIDFEFNNEYRLLEKYVLTADNLSDNNLKGSDDSVYVKYYAVNDTEELNSYTIEPKSIVVLKCVLLESNEVAKNYKIEFYGSNEEVNDMPVVGNIFEFSCEFEDNSFLASAGNVYCMVLKEGISDEKFFADGKNMNSICFFDSIDVRRNIGYCKLRLPEELPTGEYTAMIGLIEEGKYVPVKFYFSGLETEKNVQITSVEQKDKITAEILFGDGFKAGDKCRVSAERLSYTAHIDILTVPESKALSYTFEMPYDAVDGEYEFKLLYNGGGCISKFMYNKPEELIRFSSELTNQNGDIISLLNIKESESINFKVTNKTDFVLNACFYAGVFNKDGELTEVYSDDAIQINPNQENSEVKIVLDELTDNDIDLIKIYAWDKNNLRPYIGTYYIK